MSNHLLHPQGQPSHINISRGLASLGRAGDSQLVHMSDREVQGLQKLAMATGGSLTRNPQTGLLEASWLENILPLVAGAALSFTGIGAPAAALLVGAADTAINKGNWKEGLAAGLGAFGGAGLAAGLAGAGASAATTAATTGTDAASQAAAAGAGAATPAVVDAAGTAGDAGAGLASSAAGDVAGGTLQSIGGSSLAGAGASSVPAGAVASDVASPLATDTAGTAATDLSPVQVSPSAQTMQVPQLSGQAQKLYDQQLLANNSYGTNASNALQGIKQFGSSPGATASEIYANTGKLGLAGLAAPAIYNSYQQSQLQSPQQPFTYYSTKYNQGKANPNYGYAGQSPLSGQGYGPETANTYTPITYKKGGRIKKFATGGLQDTQGTGLSTLPIPAAAPRVGGIAPPAPLPTSAPPPPPPPPTQMDQYLANLNAQVTGKTPAPTQPKLPPASNPNGIQEGYNPATQTYGDLVSGSLAGTVGGRSLGAAGGDSYNPKTGTYTFPNYYGNYGNNNIHSGEGQFAKGGIACLAGGGGMLSGPGDGMSDSIPATIEGNQPAALARDEFVVPADVVSHIGNGSSSAGAQKLYQMLDRVRRARVGTAKQGKQINAGKMLPA